MIATTKIKPSENRSLLNGIRWETYQALALDLAENPSKKLTYNQGILEIMTSLPEHELNKRFLGRIVETTTEVLGLEIYSLGSTTWSREDLQRGIEPDECYYITNEAIVRGKLDFDLNIDPPPDLAIEIDIISSSLDRLSIYANLAIGEIWRFDGKNLFIYVLQNISCQLQDYSRVLSVLSTENILRFLQKRKEMGENASLKSFVNGCKIC
ncbi:flavodoxin reductases (ferredoxin-NADPH reductases) family 1 [Geminocystis sp. NIES-3708]|uniref:Uma2 family endonuclease n=1 Tax=Geminocystis sp. NIES-3708 TaxID=1615909 RepID=UPI0005FCC7D2|nr:Uma2 family endonuclease [Geminocystis sp. NIES-3708]BAQ61392.1 flavodoxin reductases (ferredoxin-NADPH reductases) family 1 [Geminocystis sp. NIES-3708]